MHRQIDMKHLADAFAKAEAILGPDETVIAKAYAVVRVFLGPDWAASQLHAWHTGSRPSNSSTRSSKHQQRISWSDAISFAHDIFRLRDCYGLPALLDRFDKLPTEACLAEAQVSASLLNRTIVRSSVKCDR